MAKGDEVKIFQLRNLNTILGVDQQIDIQKLIQHLLIEFKNIITKGSGWKLVEISSIDLHTIDYQPFGGSSYIPLPPSIQNKRAVINVKNLDQKCFRFSVEAALLKIDINPERVSNYNKSELDHMFNNIDYPMKPKDVNIFEKNNPEIGV